MAIAEPKTRFKTVKVEVERIGEKLIVPEQVKLEDAIQILQMQLLQEEQDVRVGEKFKVFPLDGAHAFYLALIERFGFANLQSTESFFGEQPPQMLTVQVAPDETIQVPWGKMQIPGIDGYLMTGTYTENDGSIGFMLGGVVKRKCERLVKELGTLVRRFLREQSLYRGRAFRIKFRDGDGDMFPMPDPKFLDLRHVKEGELIFGRAVENAISTSIFTPIERTAEARQHRIPLKRGILLAGPYGVGKTLAAYVTAKKAQANGWTFIYCEAATELPDAIQLAQHYAPAVVFCEDIDRVANGNRSEQMDRLLNTVDGIDSKDSELLVVLTTNDVEAINKALLRPGRLDAVIHIAPPDAEAAERLVRLYGRGLVADTRLPKAAAALAGTIPAVIRECVERSKLAALRHSQNGDTLVVTDDDLAESAETMQTQLQLLTPKAERELSDSERAATLIAAAVQKGMRLKMN